MTEDIRSITQHPEFTRDPKRDWTLARGVARHLPTGALVAARRAIEGRIARIEAGTERGTSTVVSNLKLALRALDGCDFGEFVPLYTVPALTQLQWDTLRDDLKDGDPEHGTARCALKPGDEKVPCLIVPEDDKNGE